MSGEKPRIEDALQRTMACERAASAPPLLGRAMQHAVFPGGQRIRPRLTLSVAKACGDDRPLISAAAAAAVELLHCASLVHDDMPCFDDAATRRGKPSVHAAFGEALALLTGDALIVLAFETVAVAAMAEPLRAVSLSLILARAVGMPNGIVAGQAFESEPVPDLARYHSAKTGALFAGAAMVGAASAGVAADPWGALGRPNAVHALGVEGAARRLLALVEEAALSVPDCPGAVALRTDIRAQATRFLPKQAARHAA